MSSGNGSQPLVRIARELPVPPHQVHQARLSPKLLSRWIAPGS
ncbi:hypothetical protein [Streptomyces sp. NPDC050388]